MKKIMVLGLMCAVWACSKTTEEKVTGLNKLNQEPQNCEFLYEINSSFSGYSEQDAYDFIEKRIVEENAFGDSYYIYNQDIVENSGAIFGPQNTYKLKAKVYNCKK